MQPGAISLRITSQSPPSLTQGFSRAKFASNFTHMQLEPLTRRQQEQIIETRLGSSAVRELLPHIDLLIDSEGQTICGNPLMLSMVISIYQAGGSVFPKTRFELYSSAVDTMLSRLDFKDIAQRRGAAGAVLELPEPRSSQ